MNTSREMKKYVAGICEGVIDNLEERNEPTTTSSMIEAVLAECPLYAQEWLLYLGAERVLQDRLSARRRQKGTVRSVGHGLWKAEVRVTTEEALNNLRKRARTGKKWFVNIAKDLKRRGFNLKAVLPEFEDDLVAFVALGFETGFGKDWTVMGRELELLET